MISTPRTAADVVLRVVASHAAGVVAGPGAHLRQPRVFPDFQAPARVVDEVELQLVQFVHGHQVDVLFHEVLVIEVAGHVEHHAAPRTVGGVLHRYRCHAPFRFPLPHLAIHFGREQLQQRLYAVEGTRRVAGCDAHRFAVGCQAVAFRAFHGRGVQFQHDAFPSPSRLQLQVVAGGAGQGGLQIFRLRLQCRVVVDDRFLRQSEVFAAAHFQVRRNGNDLLSSVGRLSFTGSACRQAPQGRCGQYAGR